MCCLCRFIHCVVFEIIVEKWQESAVLHLRTAFSRDQIEKIYVQDLLLEDGILIWNLVEKVRNNSPSEVEHSELANFFQKGKNKKCLFFFYKCLCIN
jgi:hypothetical protein